MRRVVELKLSTPTLRVELRHLWSVVVGKNPRPVCDGVEDSCKVFVVCCGEGVEVQRTGLLEVGRVGVDEDIVLASVFRDDLNAIARRRDDVVRIERQYADTFSKAVAIEAGVNLVVTRLV